MADSTFTEAQAAEVIYQVLSYGDFTNIPNALEQLNALLAELSYTMQPMNDNLVFEITNMQSRTKMLIARLDDEILGTASVSFAWHADGLHGNVENVVVTKRARGLHIGERLNRMIIQMGISELRRVKIPNVTLKLSLTSRSDRKAAHALYKRLGYIERDTCDFRLEIVP